MRESLNATDLKILAHLLSGPWRPPGIRELRELTGKSYAWVWLRLHRLRERGLVTFEDKKARTLRAACRFVNRGGA